MAVEMAQLAQLSSTVHHLSGDRRLEVFRKALELYPDKSARPVWAHPRLDKLREVTLKTAFF